MATSSQRRFAQAALVLLGSLAVDARADGLFGQLNGPDDVGPLPGVEVEVCPPSGGGECRSAITGSDGSFHFPDLPAGTYQVTSPTSSGAVASTEIVVPSDDELHLSITAP
jgi:Carboxypeptidase regulatory-like domain